MSYVDEVSPRKVQLAVQRGRTRMENFRQARLGFIKQYVGSYYDVAAGAVGTQAINLIFNAIRVLVPTMVMNFPKHTIATPYLAARQYADLLSLALDQQDIKLKIRDVYRQIIVDAIFTLGIMKTGLAQSDDILVFDDDMGQQTLDNGTVYTDRVSFENFVVDPNAKEYLFKDASFMGDMLTVPRQMLLESGLYNNELVERLPRAGDRTKEGRASELSMKQIDEEENADLEDEVEVYELWVPSANAIVTVPAAKEVVMDDYLRITDYYGVKEGPYTFLCLTPPVPDNPLPVPMVGIWYDLHILANRMAKKIVEQAERQKDLVVYQPSAADDASSMRDAGDGEAVKVDDVQAVRTVSFGGQQSSNENHLQSLENWFNMMAGNPAQVGGQNIEAKSATAANILQQNSGIGLEDMKDMMYIAAAEESRKRAWYLHTDPLMQIPLTKRQPTMQQQMIQTPQGPTWLNAPIMQEVQVILTPEARAGDFLDYTFTIEPESMGRRDSKTRLAQAQAFCQQSIPAVAAAAQIFATLGLPFSAKALLLRMAKESGIEWMDEVLFDPEFQMQMQQQQMMGPNAQDSKGQIAGQQPNNGLMPSMLQNGQPGQVQAPPANPMMQQRQGAQAGAQDAQREVSTAMRTALRPPPVSNVAQLP
jgi:hypothetical protein